MKVSNPKSRGHWSSAPSIATFTEICDEVSAERAVPDVGGQVAGGPPSDSFSPKTTQLKFVKMDYSASAEGPGEQFPGPK